MLKVSAAKNRMTFANRYSHYDFIVLRIIKYYNMTSTYNIANNYNVLIYI